MSNDKMYVLNVTFSQSIGQRSRIIYAIFNFKELKEQNHVLLFNWSSLILELESIRNK